MKKKWLIGILAGLALITAGIIFVAVQAATRTASSLVFEGTTARVTVSVSTFRDKVSVDARLFCGETEVAVWSRQGTGRVVLEETAVCEPGREYILRVAGMVGSRMFSAEETRAVCPGDVPEETLPNASSEENTEHDMTEPAEPTTPTEPAEGKEFYITDLTIAAASPSDFDPQKGVRENDVPAYRMVYDQLVSWDYGERCAKPELATGWVVGRDGLSYTFTLRDDVTFSNGQKLEADDVVFSFKDRPASVRAAATALTDILKDVTAVDAGTVQIILNEPNADLLWFLSQEYYSILNREACEQDPSGGCRIGTGGWILNRYGWIEQTSFRKYDGSWVWKEGGETATRTITFWSTSGSYQSDEDYNLTLLDRQEVQVVSEVSEGNIGSLDTARFETVTVTGASLNAFYFNCREGIFTNADLRKAVAYALDPELINEALYSGYGQPAKTLWGMYQFGYFDGFEEPLGYDPDKAREYLARSPYPDGSFTIRLAFLRQWESAAEAVKRALEETLGCTVVIVDTTEYYRFNFTLAADNWLKQNSDFSITSLSLASIRNLKPLVTDPESWRSIAGYSNDEIAALIEELQGITDEAEREEISRRIQIRLHEEMPYIPILYEPKSIVYARGVRGIEITPDGGLDFTRIEMAVPEEDLPVPKDADPETLQGKKLSQVIGYQDFITFVRQKLNPSSESAWVDRTKAAFSHYDGSERQVWIGENREMASRDWDFAVFFHPDPGTYQEKPFKEMAIEWLVWDFLTCLKDPETSPQFTATDFRVSQVELVDGAEVSLLTREIAGEFWEMNRDRRLQAGESLETLAGECLTLLRQRGICARPERWQLVRVKIWYIFEGVDGVSYEERKATTPESLQRDGLLPFSDLEGGYSLFILNIQNGVWCLMPAFDLR